MKLGYMSVDKRKKILLLSDDIRLSSGVSTMAREIIIGTAHHFNWVNMGGAISHPERGKRLDLSLDTNRKAEIDDSSVFIYPVNEYGNASILREIIRKEKPDAIMIFTDPRYWIWLFQIEYEIRKTIPIIYYNIWDSLPYPMYNKSYYESCDALFAISAQTYNINKVVLGDLADEKIIAYIPHGVNEKTFYPIKETDDSYFTLQAFKTNLFKGVEYDFTLLFNSRNLKRKAIPDLLVAWKYFIDKIKHKEKKCALVLHTNPLDEAGSNLYDVAEMIFGDDPKYNIIFDIEKYTPEEMNLLYNSVDGGILTSSNEGWGLSLTESLMCGKPIIANTTGGMQDQMRFVTRSGKRMEFTEEFGSNHIGRYSETGIFAFPVFPTQRSIVGSQPTPYISDDKANPKDISDQILYMFEWSQGGMVAWRRGENDLDSIKITWEMMQKEAREWAISEESGMSAKYMCERMIFNINYTLAKFEPRYNYELIKVKPSKTPKHYHKNNYLL